MVITSPVKGHEVKLMATRTLSASSLEATMRPRTLSPKRPSARRGSWDSIQTFVSTDTLGIQPMALSIMASKSPKTQIGTALVGVHYKSNASNKMLQGTHQGLITLHSYDPVSPCDRVQIRFMKIMYECMLASLVANTNHEPPS